MSSFPKRFDRSLLLFEKEGLELLQNSSVLVFGLGGVGGFCFDALFRAGFGKVSGVDFDIFEESNQNRQLHSEHVGEKKAEVFERKYQQKCWDLKVGEDLACRQDFADFDIFIDAVDEIRAKIAIAKLAQSLDRAHFASCGAAKRIDPLQIRVKPLAKTTQDPFAAAFRRAIRKEGLEANFPCVYSLEEPMCKALGSFMGLTASFGLLLASLAVKNRLALNKKI